MKTSMVPSALVLLSLLVLPAQSATARLSMPAAIYYGEARGVHGLVLTGMVKVAVIARINGVECARTYIDTYLAPNINYALRIPVDDGLAYRYDSSAARIGELPEICIQYDTLEFEIDGVVPPVQAPASLQVANVQAVPEPVIVALVAGLLAVLLRRYLFPRST